MSKTQDLELRAFLDHLSELVQGAELNQRSIFLCRRTGFLEPPLELRFKCPLSRLLVH